MSTIDRPTIGIALSGGSTKAVAHIGILEVLEENKIPIDYVTGCSSGAIVAASFACGTLSELKEWSLSITRQEMFSYIRIWDRRGMFDQDMVMALFNRFTKGKTFEEVKPRLALVACDVETGETVSLGLGDIATACRASCTMPFILPAVRWGNKLLVDGGLSLLTPPVNELKEMGADITIGVDIAATRNMFTRQGTSFKRFINGVAEAPAFKNFKELFLGKSDPMEINIGHFETTPSWFDIIGKAMDVEIKRKGTEADAEVHCDLLISPKVKHFKKIELINTQKMYEIGRTTAMKAIPKIKKLIAEHERERPVPPTKLKETRSNAF